MTRRHNLERRFAHFGRTHYKPLVSYVSERPPSQVPGQRALTVTPVQDEPGVDLIEEESNSGLREGFEAPNEEVKALLDQHQRYLDETGIEKTFYSLCKDLISLENLPHNPYPGFVRRIRQYAEKFHLAHKSNQKIINSLSRSTQPVRVAHLVSDDGQQSILGLPGIVQMVDTVVGERYTWLINSLTPRRNSLQTDGSGEYTNHAIPVLLGSCVFHGAVYPRPHDAIIRVEYLISGRDVEMALDLFVESFYNDILYMERESPHVVIGITLPTEPYAEQKKQWKLEDIVGEKDLFKRVVIEEAKMDHPINFMCVFRMEEHGSKYIYGCKQYTLNFVQVSEQTGEELSVTSFASLPMSAIHMGVFLDLEHADSYMNTYSLPLKDKNHREQSRQKDKRSKKKGGGSQSEGTHPEDPLAQAIINPIKSELQKSIVALHPKLDVFEVIAKLILLCGMDRTSYDDELLIDLFKMAQSTAYKLHHIQIENDMIQYLLIKFEQVSVSDVLAQVLTQHSENIVHVFHNFNKEMSADFIEAGQILAYRVTGLIHTLEQTDNGDKVQVGSILEELHRLHGYVASLKLQLVEDAYANCPKLKSVLDNLMEEFPDAIPRPQTPTREVASSGDKAKKKVLRRAQGSESFSHGAEDANIHKHMTEAIAVDANTGKETAPKSIAKESVLLKYLVDVRVDTLWPEFLIDLLGGESQPSNPYPRLVTTLRQSAQRMDLCQEKSDKLSLRLLHGAAREEVEESYTFHIPGADAHGLVSSLALLDSSVFFQLVNICMPFVVEDYVQKKGHYRVALCTGLGGHGSLYGRMAPYILEVHLEEHCFIRGPDNGAAESLNIYTKIVKDSLMAVRREGSHVLAGLFVDGVRIGAEDLQQHWHNQQDVYIQIYTKMDWRYTVIFKHLKPHYINISETSHLRYFPRDPAASYQIVFFDGEKAAFYHRYEGAEFPGDPFSTDNIQSPRQAMNDRVIEANRQHDWICLHRWLLTRNLITKGRSHVTEVWRMLHSIGAQFEYLLCLLRTLIGIVKHALRLLEQNVETENYFLGTIDLKYLGRMVQAFQQKATEISTKQLTMAAVCLPEMIARKLWLITERLSDTGEKLLLLAPETVLELEYLAGVIEALRDTSAYDVHVASPEALAMVKAIVEEPPTRPGIPNQPPSRSSIPNQPPSRSSIPNIYI